MNEKKKKKNERKINNHIQERHTKDLRGSTFRLHPLMLTRRNFH